MIKLDKYIIKKEKNNTYKLLIEDKLIGNLTNKDLNILINLSNIKYENIFFKMFANYLFKNKNVDFVYYNNQKVTKNDFYFLRKYKTILFDIDDTILDFQKSEKNALNMALKSINVIPNDIMIANYHKINIKYWEKVEKKEITRDECLILRFKEFLPLYNIDIDPNTFEETYRKYLNMQAYVKKNAHKVLDVLKNNYQLYAITNGVSQTQKMRARKAKINKYFLDSFISDAIGYHKPDIRYFNYIKENIKNFDLKSTLIVGDSLTSDIKLGNNANVDTVWFNFDFKENKSNIKPTYTINSLLELLYF